MKVNDIKNKLLNKIADKLKDYRTPEYDKILVCDIKGEKKGAFMTYNCSTIKELPNKYEKGMIDVGKVLEEELDKGEKYHSREIIFCDKGNVVCLYNSVNNSYYEEVHECFDPSEERVYIKCDNNLAYESLKNFVYQSSKYHDFVKYEYEIPKKEAFDKIFSEKEQIDEEIKKQEEFNKDKEEVKSYDNYVQITGKVSNIGKEFTKKDGEKAKFIEIKQEYEYNDKIKYNKISVMLPSELINDISNMTENDTISIKGKLHTYNDKDNNMKSVINCTEINILDMTKNQEEMER